MTKFGETIYDQDPGLGDFVTNNKQNAFITARSRRKVTEVRKDKVTFCILSVEKVKIRQAMMLSEMVLHKQLCVLWLLGYS